jgi:alanyl-tRNA synthetase
VVTALVSGGAEVGSLATGERGLVILNQTPFYAESGGQVGDVGVAVGPGVRARVIDTKKKLGDVFAHEVEIEEGTLSVGAALELKVDHAARSAIRANHSATHLLHEALRMVLGDHVAQKGSLVTADRLRFDIAHPKPISAAEIAEVEDIANSIILRNEPVVTRLMGIEEARHSGARALFGEKYGDEVRVVSMGTIEGGDNGPRPYSVELCGGTHVRRTGDIGLVSIVGDSAVAAGVRRIEARTRDEARKRLTEDSRAYADLAALLRAPSGSATERLEALLEDKKKLERELADARRKLAMGGGGSGAGDAVRDVAGVKLYARVVAGVEMKDLKSLADEARTSLGSGLVAIVATAEDGKASLVVSVTPDLVARFNAVDLVRLGAAALGGKGGGGRPDMAQAGGPDGAKATEALAAVEEGVRAKAAG